jgi:plastocyanin
MMAHPVCLFLPWRSFTSNAASILAPTPAPVPVDHKITVGNNGILSYNPANISASIGDTVTFEFHPKNHTVTQSSFLNPCQALELASGAPGFKSGL